MKRKGQSLQILHIQDNTSSYLVTIGGADGKLISARRVARILVSSDRLDGIGTKDQPLPPASKATLDRIAATMQTFPEASVMLEGFGSDSQHVLLALPWIDKIEDALLSKGVDSSVIFRGRFFERVGFAQNKDNYVQITIERPKF